MYRYLSLSTSMEIYPLHHTTSTRIYKRHFDIRSAIKRLKHEFKHNTRNMFIVLVFCSKTYNYQTLLVSYVSILLLKKTCTHNIEALTSPLILQTRYYSPGLCRVFNHTGFSMQLQHGISGSVGLCAGNLGIGKPAVLVGVCPRPTSPSSGHGDHRSKTVEAQKGFNDLSWFGIVPHS